MLKLLREFINQTGFAVWELFAPRLELFVSISPDCLFWPRGHQASILSLERCEGKSLYCTTSDGKTSRLPYTLMTITGNKMLETSRKSLRYFLCIKFSQNAERTCVPCPSTAALLFANPRKKHSQNDFGETSQKNITLKFALLYYYQQ